MRISRKDFQAAALGILAMQGEMEALFLLKEIYKKFDIAKTEVQLLGDVAADVLHKRIEPLEAAGFVKSEVRVPEDPVRYRERGGKPARYYEITMKGRTERSAFVVNTSGRSTGSKPAIIPVPKPVTGFIPVVPNDIGCGLQ